MRIPRRTAAAVIALAALAGCGGGGDDEAATADTEPAAAEAEGSGAEVTIATFNFQPDPLTVEPGTTILFTTEDKINHTVTAGTREAPTPDEFDGKLDDQGATFELTLDEPGTYDYFCAIHPGEGMTGQIVVEG